MSELVIVNQNHHVTFQDIGRYHCARYGLSQGGAADLLAHCWGQKLLGNSVHATSLEILLGRVKLRAIGDLVLVLTGADCNAGNATTGNHIAPWQPFSLNNGEELHLGIPKSGLRSYLSVAGGFNVIPFMGSTSTVERNHIGGPHQGLALQLGDRLAVGPEPNNSLAVMPTSAIPIYAHHQELRLIPAFQYSKLPQHLIDKVLATTYRVTPNSNRMGVRLESLEHDERPDEVQPLGSLISEGIVCGAVQLPPDGDPIIMLQDRQTLGGYNKLGTIAFRDLPTLGQMRPGDTLRFVLTDLEIERVKQRAFYHYFGL
ncbi:biotin-dependent carboxyltransferase family protein [Vibrio hangzhouensis]|uniref:5-oxoprolinase subunit C family protein n=1 Tax=Vibrio hangzhouensis TaxID=462991 RepID=UPI001C94B7E1|nr:biotin-dependent carboxyltransferase family protein [Vibrio hangzhouensis]MBY6197605.1 biotin-dependent carboxyltransferase family protein [Vibrio hangzhouensis]